MPVGVCSTDQGGVKFDVDLSACVLAYQKGCTLGILGLPRKLLLGVSRSQSLRAQALVSEHTSRLNGALTSHTQNGG